MDGEDEDEEKSVFDEESGKKREGFVRGGCDGEMLW